MDRCAPQRLDRILGPSNGHINSQISGSVDLKMLTWCYLEDWNISWGLDDVLTCAIIAVELADV
jgi:hypothetical protein